jgi:divalent metal cation (Fe/Co/Zn/Cd) transporter
MEKSRREKKERSTNMPLVNIVLLLIIVGVVLWLINSFIPMAGSIKSILNAVVVIAVIIWLLNVFGLLTTVAPKVHIG